MDPLLFLCYRRADTEWFAEVLGEELDRLLVGSTHFLDRSSIQEGDNWPDSIRSAIQSATVMLVLIGRSWLAEHDDYGRRRIDDEADWVRREVAAGLERQRCVVIPVLIDGAEMPPPDALPSPLRALPSHQALELRSLLPDEDVASLTSALARHGFGYRSDPAARRRPRQRSSQRLPDRPFRDLLPFAEEDEGVFFGRRRELDALHELLLTPYGAPRIVLLHGNSGVGKTSLLRAGLIPLLRLRGLHEVRYVRRSAETGVGLGIVEALGGARSLAEFEGMEGAPAILIVDQLEEVFFSPNEDPDAEAADLIRFLLADSDARNRQRGTVVLAVRADGAPQWQRRLEDARLTHHTFPIAPLAPEAVLEVVLGLTSTQMLRQRYRLRIVDADLPALVRTQITRDSASSIAPLLQIWLTRLWDQAGFEGGDRIWNIELFHRLRLKGFGLTDFLRSRLDGLRREWPNEIENGLALDVLLQCAGPLRTSVTTNLAELRKRYPDARDLDRLLESMSAARLLLPTQSNERDTEGYRLPHDELAGVVLDAHANSQRVGQRAARILRTKVRDAGSLLLPTELWTVSQGAGGMPARSPEESRLVKSSTVTWLLGAATIVTATWLLYSFQASESRARDELAAGGLLAQADRLNRLHPDEAGKMEQWLARASGVQASVPSDDLAAAIDTVKDRKRRAESLAERSIASHQDLWQEVTKSLRAPPPGDPYCGSPMHLPPQLGLVPLGRDQRTALWEFAVLETGEIPGWIEDPGPGHFGHVEFTASSAIVLVLLPGSRFFPIGGAAIHPQDNQSDELKRRKEAGKYPVHEVDLQPFFVSKYEVSQAQWRTITGGSPSRFPDDDLPVERVSWDDCTAALHRVSLTLPTSAQWEYACRAGRRKLTPWWSGDVFADLGSVANVRDVTSLQSAEVFTARAAPFADDYQYTAPVHALRPNPFGLYHVHGNVYEWCQDAPAAPGTKPHSGDGRTGTDPTSTRDRIDRGGGYSSNAFRAYSWVVFHRASTYDMETLGCRPSRPAELESDATLKPAPQRDPVCINELRAPQSAQDTTTFVELRGRPNQSIAGYRLVCFRSGDRRSPVVLPQDARLDASGFALIGRTKRIATQGGEHAVSCVVTCDPTDWLDATPGSALHLVSPDGIVADTVGWGPRCKVVEIAPAPLQPTPIKDDPLWGLSRASDRDSQNNGRDFVIATITPGESNVALPEFVSGPSQLAPRINEVMPNTDQLGDEGSFVEIRASTGVTWATDHGAFALAASVGSGSAKKGGPYSCVLLSGEVGQSGLFLVADTPSWPSRKWRAPDQIVRRDDIEFARPPNAKTPWNWLPNRYDAAVRLEYRATRGGRAILDAVRWEAWPRREITATSAGGGEGLPLGPTSPVLSFSRFGPDTNENDKDFHGTEPSPGAKNTNAARDTNYVPVYKTDFTKPDQAPTNARRKVVLFDQSKSQRSGRTGHWILSPNGDYSDWAWQLYEQGYTVRTVGTGKRGAGERISSDDLEGVDVLVIAEPQNPYDHTERRLIGGLLDRGGGILYLANHRGADRDRDKHDSWTIWNSGLGLAARTGAKLADRDTGGENLVCSPTPEALAHPTVAQIGRPQSSVVTAAEFVPPHQRSPGVSVFGAAFLGEVAPPSGVTYTPLLQAERLHLPRAPHRLEHYGTEKRVEVFAGAFEMPGGARLVLVGDSAVFNDGGSDDNPTAATALHFNAYGTRTRNAVFGINVIAWLANEDPLSEGSLRATLKPR